MSASAIFQYQNTLTLEITERGLFLKAGLSPNTLIQMNTLFTRLVYMHLNPLDIISGKEWREHKLQNWEEIKKPLFDYPWSSLKSFFEPSSDNSLLSGQEIITAQFKNKEEYEGFLKDWSMPDSFTDNEFE